MPTCSRGGGGGREYCMRREILYLHRRTGRSNISKFIEFRGRFQRQKTPLLVFDPKRNRSDEGTITKRKNRSSLNCIYLRDVWAWVYRVPGFLSSRPNWVPPLPQPQGSVAPPPFGFKGKRHTRLRRRGWGGPNSDEGKTLWYSLYTKIPLRPECRLCI